LMGCSWKRDAAAARADVEHAEVLEAPAGHAHATSMGNMGLPSAFSFASSSSRHSGDYGEADLAAHDDDSDDELLAGAQATFRAMSRMSAKLCTEDANHEAPRARSESELTAMNAMLHIMWPYLCKAISRKARSEMLEKAAFEMEKHQKKMTIHEFEVELDVGECPPTLTGMRTYRRRKTEAREFEGLQFDIDFQWRTEKFRMMPRIHATSAHMPVMIVDKAVTDLQMSATCSILVAPLIDQEPCFGATQVFFPNLPECSMKIEGMDTTSFMGMGAWLKKLLTKTLHKMIFDLLNKMFVLPNRRLLKARPDVALETLVELKSPLPIGLLEVQVLEARNLPRIDMLGPGADPFVKVRLGDAEIQTSAAKGVNAMWEDPPEYLPVFNLAQILEVSVHDQNVLKKELMGHMRFYTVWSFWKAMEDGKNGFKEGWFDLEQQNLSHRVVQAGQLKLRVRYLAAHGRLDKNEKTFEEARKQCKAAAAPSLLSVKVLGLEGEAAQFMKGATCFVSYEPPEVDQNEGGIGHWVGGLAEAAHGIGEALHLVTHEKTPTRRRGPNAWGKAGPKLGMPNCGLTGRAKLWADGLQLKSMNMSAETVRAIEQLRYRENWEEEKIAGMFGISLETVKAAAELRPCFATVWHEAKHFVQYPEEHDRQGIVSLTVRLPKQSLDGARIAVDHTEGKITDRQAMLSNVTTSGGLVGEVRLNLSSDPVKPDTWWSRRVRARLRRGDQPATKETLTGDAQCDPSIGNPVPNCLIEFVIEVRPLLPEDPKYSIEDGQAVVGVCRAFGDDEHYSI